MRILIIEDDKVLAKTIEQCIGKAYDIDHAYDGEEGVLYAMQSIYDAIILDIMMPILDGYEVLSKLRNEKNTPRKNKKRTGIKLQKQWKKKEAKKKKKVYGKKFV